MAAMDFVAPLILLTIACYSLNIRTNQDKSNTKCLLITQGKHSAFNASETIGLEALHRLRVSATRPAILDLKRPKLFTLLSLLLLSGSVEPNPGPNYKFPCGICSKPVRINQRGIQCDFCDIWSHIRCLNMNTIIYDALANSSCVWECCACGMPNFSSSLLDSFAMVQCSNQFSCLDSSDTTLGPPLLSSSPGDQQYSPDSTTSCSQSSKPIRKHSLTILTVNCRSLRSERKRCELQSLVDTFKPDIINATETHIDDNVLTAELGLQGYEIYRQDRKCGGGGVLVATNQDSIISSRIHSLEDEHVESVWCKIEIAGTKPLYNGCMYRTPDRQPESIYYLDSTLNKITSSPCLPNVLVTGDFNLPDISWDCTDCENKYIVKANPQYGVLVNQAFIDTIHEHSLSQGVTEPTRENNILDLVLTTNPDLISRTEVLNGMSDHSIVLSTVNLKTRTPKKKPRKVFFYKKADVYGLRAAVANALAPDWQEWDQPIETYWAFFKDTLSSIMDTYIPHKHLSGRWNVPWMTGEIRRAIRKKQRLYNRAKTTQRQSDWMKFKKLRAKVKEQLRESYHSYIANLLKPPEQDKKPSMGKRFWSFVKSRRRDTVGVAGLRETPDGNVITDSKTKAEILSNQFKSVFTVEDTSNLPVLPTSPFPDIADLTHVVLLSS
ncbi:uncharacterized protein LOC125572237 [Nematostella vectensis]|uniref:uncharacterized protein LOC125572237 n=1 Tax=Nematostella vectensis TaxID=45351 RepID=UPI0020778408|nr:uncharacterized protein LOC125572237 [Nematostella vectensis]